MVQPANLRLECLRRFAVYITGAMPVPLANCAREGHELIGVLMYLLGRALQGSLELELVG